MVGWGDVEEWVGVAGLRGDEEVVRCGMGWMGWMAEVRLADTFRTISCLIRLDMVLHSTYLHFALVS